MHLSKFALILFSVLFVHSSLAAVEDSFRANLDKNLNRARTQVSLALYSQVLLELMEQTEADKTSWIARLQSALHKAYDPVKDVDNNRLCLKTGLLSWGRLTDNGEFATTAQLTAQLLKSTDLAPACRPFWESLVGSASLAHAHGQFLAHLQDAELIVHLHARKLAHLEAVKLTLVTRGQRHLGAAANIAAYYANDSDEEVKAAAFEVAKQILSFKKIEFLLSIVRPDTLMAPIPAAVGAVRLVKGLRSFGVTEAIAASLGLHLAAGAALLSKASSPPDAIPTTQFKLRVVKDKTQGMPLEKSVANFVESFSNDLLMRPQLIQATERDLRRSLRLKKDDFDLAAFLVQLDINEVPETDPIEYNQDVENLRRLSEEVGSELGNASLPIVNRINASRKKVFEKTPIESYRRFSPGLVGLLRGEGGNCVANTKLMISVFWPHRQYLPSGTILALEVFSDHIQPVIFNTKTLRTTDLVSGRTAVRPKGGLYHPAILLNGYLLRQNVASAFRHSEFLIRAADIKKPSESENNGHDQQKQGSVKTRLNMLAELLELHIPAARETIIFPQVANRVSTSSPPLFGKLSFKNIDPQKIDPDPTSLVDSESGSGSEPGNASKVVRKFWSLSNLQEHSHYRRLRISKILQRFEVMSLSLTQNQANRTVLGSYDFLIQSEELRTQLEFAKSDKERAALLLPLFRENAADQLTMARGFKQLLMNPREPMLMDEGLKLVGMDRLFNPERLLEQLDLIESIRSNRVPIERNTQIPQNSSAYSAVLQRSYAYPEMAALISTELECLEMLSQSPELLARVLDDPAVPRANKLFLMSVYRRKLSGAEKPHFFLAHNDGTQHISPRRPKEYTRLIDKIVSGLTAAVLDPTVIGISDRISKEESQPAQFRILTGQSLSKFTIYEEERKKSQGIVVQVLPSCRSKDELGRCREQDEQFQTSPSARIYVSPRTFIDLIGLINLPPEDTNMHSALAKRWTSDVDRAFVTYMKTETAQNWRDYRPSGEARALSVFISWQIPILAQALQERFKDSSWRMETEANQSIAGEDEQTVLETAAVPTSQGIFEVHRCEKDLDQLIARLKEEPYGYLLDERGIPPELRSTVSRLLERAVRRHLRCYEEALKRMR